MLAIRHHNIHAAQTRAAFIGDRHETQGGVVE